uniref:Carbamoyl phosphate synthase small chain n=1 Tax=Polysiphonia sp. TaxID=1967842 RepID=A0A1Z1MTG4_9FLOR|nr:carbamoyl phosphate synthase small subunit [Polysiphonia sp.]
MPNRLYRATLYLEDGTCYKGYSLFPLPFIVGEVVFNTGMTGYQEIISDPSYSGQMIVFTCPELGNTGLNKYDNESNFIHTKAIIAKNISNISSSWRSTLSLRDYIIAKNIPHIFNVDTRSLTKHLRLFGVMNASLFQCRKDNNVDIRNSFSLDGLDLIRKVSTKKMYNVGMHVNEFSAYYEYNTISSNLLNFRKKSKKYKVLVIDLGLKFNILRKLSSFECNVCVVPPTSSYESILSYKPDGVLFSNGPGNPSIANYAINIAKKLIYFSNIPIFGICMGHQVLNIAFGKSTFKLQFGHRGLNHPSGIHQYSEITSQNHGFAVQKGSFNYNELLDTLQVKSLNFNDLTISGTFNIKLPVFSVQYHPEASPGPHDSEYLFRVFIKLIDYLKYQYCL